MWRTAGLQGTFRSTTRQWRAVLQQRPLWSDRRSTFDRYTDWSIDWWTSGRQARPQTVNKFLVLDLLRWQHRTNRRHR